MSSDGDNLISVNVDTRYLEDQSDPDERRYVFAYTITIRNRGKTPARLLGRPYRITGTVVGGARRGRTIGFPTANLADVPTVVPGTGVYAVRAAVDGKPWPAAANVGPNPTFGEDDRKIEVHLIGYYGDLYGKPLAVEFVRKLRDTRPFAGMGELVEQLRRDVDAAKAVLGAS